MREPTKRERQPEERRQQLIATALALFATTGFKNTTIKDVAEAAGVAKGFSIDYLEST